MNGPMGFNSMGPTMLREAGGGCNSCSSGGAKRKLTEYNKFVKKEIVELKKKFPEKKQKDLMKLVGAKWNSLKLKKPSNKK